MNLLDIVLIIVVALSVIGGFREGFARGGIGFVAAIVGIFAGFWYMHDVGAHLAHYVSSPVMANFMGFSLVLAACVIAGAIVGLVLATMFKWVGLSWFDRLVGGLFGFARGVVMAVALLTIYLACSPSPQPRAVTHSRFAPYLIDASDVMATMIPHEFRDVFHSTTARVRKAWAEHLKSSGSEKDEEAAHI
jgi:membrane protein required for colicin V production